jgi:hypothetical protein
MRTEHELADVLRAHWPVVEQSASFNSWQIRILSALKKCRTAELGGHKLVCTECGVMKIQYNSCRNRHCPKCQGKKREEWIQKRDSELLAVGYFHVVFTLPDTLNGLALSHPKEVYDTLFEAAWGTVNTFGHDPKHLGAQTGMVCILHTWGQTLSLHPHLHCIIPGGGLTKENRWKSARGKGKYLFPVLAMSQVFRTLYLKGLQDRLKLITDPEQRKALSELHPASWWTELYKKNWVVFAKKPFAHPKAVVEYLGRYTHKIAISNSRILEVKPDHIRIAYKDYRQQGSKKEMTLEPLEFIRRFSLHILPKRFVRIRHYGILSGTSKPRTLPVIRDLLPDTHTPAVKDPRCLKAFSLLYCCHCKKESMVIIELIPKRGPPIPERLRTLAVQF